MTSTCLRTHPSASAFLRQQHAFLGHLPVGTIEELLERAIRAEEEARAQGLANELQAGRAFHEDLMARIEFACPDKAQAVTELRGGAEQFEQAVANARMQRDD